jgi:hypothetical protein
MPLDLESRLRVFFASAPQAIYPVRTLEISHSAFSQTWLLWRETAPGTITTEAGPQPVLPANFEVKLAGAEGHLDQRYTITFGLADTNDSFRAELDRIPLDSDEKIAVVYREYLSDDLTTAQAIARLQVESVSMAIGVATLSAVSPRLNATRTGELYTPRDVPMLRGFL